MPDDLSQTIPPVPPMPPTVPPEPPVEAPFPPPPPPVAPLNPPVVPPAGLPDGTQPAKSTNKVKIGLAIAVLFLVGAALPAAVWLTSQRQEVRKEAQGQVCCRVMAKNLCGAANGWDQVATGATRAECDTYKQNPPGFSYSCNCGEYCSSGGGGANSCTDHDQNQICTTGLPKNIECGKSRCSTSNSNDFRVEDVNPAACVGPTATPPAPTPTPTTTTVGCYQPCTRNVTVCGPGLVCEDSDEGVGLVPLYLCLNHSCPGSPTCTCAGPTATPQPTNTPRPTATPTQPTGPTISCLTCRAYDTNWNQITPASIQLGQTVYFATQGSTNHPQGITKARFRINGAAWQETTNKHGDLFYIQYTVAAAGSYLVESMVFNPILGWH